EPARRKARRLREVPERQEDEVGEEREGDGADGHEESPPAHLGMRAVGPGGEDGIRDRVEEARDEIDYPYHGEQAQDGALEDEGGEYPRGRGRLGRHVEIHDQGPDAV